MYLIYADESGSTDTDLEHKGQPFFVLSSICVSAKNWHSINDCFENEKIKIYSDFKNVEIHTNELFNSNPKSVFYKNYWKDNFKILYPRLKSDNKNIIEKVFYINSNKNNFIQIADICSFYTNKYHCIKRECSTMDNFKKEHCLKMYEKLSKIFYNEIQPSSLDKFDNYFI